MGIIISWTVTLTSDVVRSPCLCNLIYVISLLFLSNFIKLNLTSPETNSNLSFAAFYAWINERVTLNRKLTHLGRTDWNKCHYKTWSPSNHMITILVADIAFWQAFRPFCPPPSYFDVSFLGGKHVLFCGKLDGLSEKHSVPSPQHGGEGGGGLLLALGLYVSPTSEDIKPHSHRNLVWTNKGWVRQERKPKGKKTDSYFQRRN